jgi:hypothetical protein
MFGETQGQSHQISNISIGPDNKLYVHNGDGFNAGTALNLDAFRGKILRMNLDGTAPIDNPFYNAANGINARDYVFAYGVRNPFGGAWRALDGKHYEVENGPSIDRLARIDRGASYGWNGSDISMTVGAIYNWNPAHAPVNLAFIQKSTFDGSKFQAEKMDHLFVSESGPTYAPGAQANGKRIVEFVLDANGNRVSGPTTLVEYMGTGHSTVVGLAAGPDGLYFTELYEESGATSPTASGARIFRVRYVNPLPGDYDIDGDVDQNDRAVWSGTHGSNLLRAADGNRNGVVDIADYVVWRDALGATTGAAAGASRQVIAEMPLEQTTSASFINDGIPTSSRVKSLIGSESSAPPQLVSSYATDQALLLLVGGPSDDRTESSLTSLLRRTADASENEDQPSIDSAFAEFDDVL